MSMSKKRNVPDTLRKKDKFFVKSKVNHKQKNTGDFFRKSDEKVDGTHTSNVAGISQRVNDSKKHPNEHASETKAPKKPFDKKLYRLKKYSKKYKVEQWEERRKKAVLREYRQKVKNEPKSNVSKIYEELDEEGDEGNDKIIEENENNLNIKVAEEHATASVSKARKIFQKPHEKFRQVKEDKERRREEFLKRKAEREIAVREAQKARFERSKKLSRKTKKGQPVMKYRMEMLLEKIQKSMT